MSIGGIGSHSGHDLSKVLSALLSRLDTSEGDATAPPSDTSGSAGDATCNKGWQRGEARLSSDILTVLLRLQQQEEKNAQTQSQDDAVTPDPAAPADTAATDATATDAPPAPSDSPVHRLFAAIDADEDGNVTKEEFETFIKAKGGTQEEADKLYALLDKDGDGKLSEEQLAQAIKRGHHGHHYGWLARPNAERLFAKIDGDGDGKLTKDEMEKFVTDRGGRAERADKFFARADKDGDGTVDQAELAQAIRPHAHRPRGRRGGKDDGDSA